MARQERSKKSVAQHQADAAADLYNFLSPKFHAKKTLYALSTLLALPDDSIEPLDSLDEFAKQFPTLINAEPSNNNNEKAATSSDKKRKREQQDDSGEPSLMETRLLSTFVTDIINNYFSKPFVVHKNRQLTKGPLKHARTCVQG